MGFVDVDKLKKPQWDFFGGLYYSGTLYTTIGIVLIKLTVIRATSISEELRYQRIYRVRIDHSWTAFIQRPIAFQVMVI